MSESPQQQSRLKELIAKGREQGYLTYAEVNDHLPEDISDPDQVEDIIQMINDMGISVFESAPDADTLLMTAGDSTADEIAAAEAAAALAAVETEQHRTTDPVRMYMREMGSVELLTREGGIEIAKRIEEGIRELMSSLAEWPRAVDQIIAEYDLVATGERKLADIISGYLDPMEYVPSALEQSAANEANEEETNQDEDGLDIDEARSRFEALRKQNDKTKRALARHGRSSDAARKNLMELGELFKYLKLTPRQFDPMIQEVREVLEQIRREERNIMTLCVRHGKMPREEFIRSFPGNETNDKWLATVYKKKAAYAERLKSLEDDILRSQRKLLQIEDTYGISVPQIKDINRRMSIG
ncbi:MAG TPA: RNA polymerase sigma factor region1.1 domain-containing protein, partial [Porticoccaceae bacterium]